MKILITGGLGNLGSWLTRHFSSLDNEVYVLAKNKRAILTEQKFTYISCDISSLDDCKDKLAHIAFDYIIHIASVNDMFVDNYAALALEINTKGTRNLLEAIDKSSLKNFIYFSTFHVYGVSEGNITEESPLLARHDYATTHLFAEYYVKQFHLTHHLPYTIIRLTNSYGCPIDTATSKWYLILNDLSKMALEKSEIILKSNGLASRDFIWMGTVCTVVEKLVNLKNAPNDCFNLSGERTFKMLEIAQYVQKAILKYAGKNIEIKTNINDTSTPGKSLIVSSAKLKKLINYDNPIQFEEEATNIFQLLQSNQ
jgi:nucleoside-diphosphate-sugar epimerase